MTWKEFHGDFLRNLKSKKPILIPKLRQKFVNSGLIFLKKNCNILTAWAPTAEQVNCVFSMANSWVLSFLALSKLLEEYDSKAITLYIHILVYHVPMLLCKHMYSSLKQFTGQGVEKFNDDIKLIFHRKTNRHDTTLKALRLRQRKYINRTSARMKKKVQKVNQKYWSHGERSTYSIKALTCKSMNDTPPPLLPFLLLSDRNTGRRIWM